MVHIFSYHVAETLGCVIIRGLVGVLCFVCFLKNTLDTSRIQFLTFCEHLLH